MSNLTTATQACWFVGDGSRVGLSDNTSISGPSFLPFFGSLSPITEGGNPNNYCATLKTEFPVFDSLTQCNDSNAHSETPANVERLLRPE